MKRYIDPAKIRIIAQTSDDSGEALVLLADIRAAISMTPSEPVILLDSPEMIQIVNDKLREFAEKLKEKSSWFTGSRADEIAFQNVLEKTFNEVKKK